ncbi:MAG: hypothetical protein H8D87_10465 [Deltaproteobacteria bacterium]|uniref:hypothetical protein n=1 Tax=Desulfobacula sp. TaxID=2593537 RepID=UPI0019B088DA|nr:hypothetical protein [Candidatus Desulfobacula maris]MBL6994396.1 hypothetical protein [Desulfobacula sp.]
MNKKEIVFMGIFSTLIMDIGFVFLKVTNIVKGSMEPQFLGRWILNMFNGQFVQENIRMDYINFTLVYSLSMHWFWCYGYRYS